MSIRIKSSVQLKLLDSNIQQIKDSLYSSGVANLDHKGIYARIAATHAGIINRNNFFYLPNKMKDGINTFVTPFQKPVLINHNEEGDPIGRIVSARYVDTSTRLHDNVQVNQAADFWLKQLLQDNLTLEDQVKLICDNMSSPVLADETYTGLGYAEIIAHITDEKAVEKFLDGRYLTGSVAAATDHAFCSICKEDWSSSVCDHRPGKIYDDKKMFFIAGDFTYEHWAVVNTPADMASQALEISNGLTDSVKVENIELSGKLHEVKVDLLDNFKEEDGMKGKKDTQEAPKVEVEKSQEVEESQKEEVKDEVVQDTKETVADAEASVVQDTEIKEEVKDESFDDFMTRVLDSKQDLTDEDQEKIYDLLVNELKEEGLEDAKLSTEKRKKLAKSTFCGPGRSFPVPDCAHVTAARRLIGRYKGGSKEKILACVNRKAKAMGCDKAKDSVKDSAVHSEILRELLNIVSAHNWAEKDNKHLNDKELSTLQTLIEKMASLVTTDAFVQTALKIKDIKLATDKELLDEIVKLETELGTLRDTLKDAEETTAAAQEEMQISLDETNTLRATLVEAQLALRNSKLTQLSILRSLKEGKKVEIEDSKELSDVSIDSDLEILTKNIDIQNITDKLNNGMSRIPEGVVSNPAVAQNGQQDGQQQSHQIEDVKKELQMIEQNYTLLLFRNPQKASVYKHNEISRMRREGKIP